MPAASWSTCGRLGESLDTDRLERPGPEGQTLGAADDVRCGCDIWVEAHHTRRSPEGLGPYTRLYETFARLVHGEEVPADPRPGTFADGVAVMEVLDAIRRSAATGEATVP